MMKPASSLLVCSVLLNCSVAAADDAAGIRAAVSQALPYIQERGEWWITEKKCVSCHRVSFMTWSLSAAAKAGFDVDRHQLEQWQQWSHEALLAPREKDDKPVGTGNVEALSQIVWSERDKATGDVYSQFAELIATTQNEDGTWSAGGQLPGQKRPAAETHAVSTMWNVLALGAADGDVYQETRSKGTAHSDSVADPVSTEWYVARILLAIQEGADPRPWLDVLRDRQQEDGGWGWVHSDESDALATGMALYALRSAGVASDDPAVQRATQSLIATQNDDGSWTVPGTKAKAKGRPVETANYWGSCWAVIGLVATLERPVAVSVTE